jgi:hypothetical protein
MRLRIRHALVSLTVLAVLGLSACKDERITPIGDLLDNPSEFEGKKVRVAGEVTDAIGVLGYGGYRLKDETGRIAVVVQGSGAPRVGARVVSEGTFRSAFTLGTESIAAIVESRRATP